LDWLHTESAVGEVAQKQTAYFVPVCARRCTQDQMKLPRKAYPALSLRWTPCPAGRLRQGIKVSSYLS